MNSPRSTASSIDAQNALDTVFGAPPAQRANPSTGEADVVLDDAERRHAAGLMRINHVGEVCAQALYVGQAAVARDETTRAHLLAAAQEETDHLAWCAQRLDELDSRPSLLNPLWYAGSYAIGALAGLRGDGWNLGFVVETERQVEAHLDEHLQTLPAADARSRAILAVMKADEARHADHAQAQGARVLPPAGADADGDGVEPDEDDRLPRLIARQQHCAVPAPLVRGRFAPQARMGVWKRVAGPEVCAANFGDSQAQPGKRLSRPGCGRDTALRSPASGAPRSSCAP